ncbi:MbtH family protein, partial [Klebsiella pneumoniae]
MQFSNPFDNPQGQFYILRNDQQQYSLWPAHCDLPAGCTAVDHCAECKTALADCRRG